MNYTFKWSVLWTGESGQWLLSGLIVTLKLSAPFLPEVIREWMLGHGLEF